MQALIRPYYMYMGDHYVINYYVYSYGHKSAILNNYIYVIYFRTIYGHKSALNVNSVTNRMGGHWLSFHLIYIFAEPFP